MRKSLLISETQTNQVLNHNARAQAAPHKNADGHAALERFAKPL